MVRYRMRSESDVEFSMLDLLFTAPANTHKADSKLIVESFFLVFPPSTFLTSAAAARPNTRSPVLSVPVGPHGLDLIYGGGATHAVEALPRATVRQRAVGA